MSHLDELEAESVYVLREAFAKLERPAILWSLGKDSNVVLWLTRKAFLGHVPFPVMHVDTGKKFKEMYEFRDRYAKEWGLNFIREECPPVEATDPTLPPAARSAARKTLGLKAALAKHQFTGLVAGIRRDEEAIRAKERYFSPRSEDGSWNLKDQPPEVFEHYMTTFPPGVHVRIHPLLHWTELDIWRYTKRESIPVIDLYFARNGMRYRSLGDEDITKPVPSTASTIDEIIAELETTKVAERSGRAMDHEAEDSFERLRASGYL
ncbi:MAG TPA: sulfate adenylyltransferase subunit CysD [Geminicoccus sp.]|jgi:sulfate adenylyltransferase subunit 2|uniref:sulfate adenylyltransferase subunit CysD n=1 Tax=Geminicoccus sp. TaxID=2024832 RepID=UPI002E36F92D|nr:sulfate adenylyltransferase subunit CysD [Geminicoccus sp.]HEX2527946.1 sulfate adenylyltransferase subunit CysD [Geminicoccus sp.]